MEAREARRRRILARGSDRLAFITGEKPTLSPASQPTIAPSGTSVDPSSPTTARSGDAALIRLLDTSPTTRVALEDAHIADPIAGAKFDAEASARVLRDVRQQLQALNDDESRDIAGTESIATLQHGTSQTKDDSSTSTNSDAQRFDARAGGFVDKPVTHVKPMISSVTCNRIARCIDATENYRVLGALLLAVVLISQSFSSCVDQRMHKWVLPWPVALVIVIDISLVCGALLLGSSGPSLFGEVQKDEGNFTQESQMSQAFEMASKLENVVEVGTVLLKTSQAFLLDCSIYIVILISGYSLLQLWQPAFCSLGG